MEIEPTIKHQESPPQERSLLEAFKVDSKINRTSDEVIVCRATRVDLGPNSAIELPIGAKLTLIAGNQYSGQQVSDSECMIIITDSNVKIQLPFTAAQQIMVE